MKTMKRTRLLLLGIAVLFLVSFRIPHNLLNTQSGGLYDNDTAYKEKTSDISLGKQSAVNSSAKTQGFNEIFETGGANGVKLNARAVSFVKDYMDKEGKNLEKM